MPAPALHIQVENEQIAEHTAGHNLPWDGKVAAERPDGSYKRYTAHMRLTAETIPCQKALSESGKAPREASPKFGQSAQLTEGLYSRTS